MASGSYRAHQQTTHTALASHFTIARFAPSAAHSPSNPTSAPPPISTAAPAIDLPEREPTNFDQRMSKYAMIATTNAWDATRSNATQFFRNAASMPAL